MRVWCEGVRVWGMRVVWCEDVTVWRVKLMPCTTVNWLVSSYILPDDSN